MVTYRVYRGGYLVNSFDSESKAKSYIESLAGNLRIAVDSYHIATYLNNECIFNYAELKRCGMSLASYVRTFGDSLAFDDNTMYVVNP